MEQQFHVNPPCKAPLTPEGGGGGGVVGQYIDRCISTRGASYSTRLSNKQLRANCSDPDGRLAYSFTKLMFNGKTKHALDILSGQGKGRLLHLSEVTDAKESTTVRDVLESNHPSAGPLYPECLDTNTDPLWYITQLFEALDGSAIRAATLRSSGSAGSSGLDTYG